MLYIHIPFCAHKCAYCDFVSFAGREAEIGSYVERLIREMGQRPSAVPIRSIFLGGGTPSLLPPAQLARLFAAIHAHYDVAPDAEITCEANPGTLTKAWLDSAREGGVNRLSLGVQAVQTELLRYMERIHAFSDVEAAVHMARAAGIFNLSADLIYALPGQTLAHWEESLARTLSLPFGHLSCYALIVEEDTPFGRLEQGGHLPRPDEEEELAMADSARRTAGQHGLVQYEVSNYALPGKECRHNVGYWTRVPYIGLGCAAHSLVDGVRIENPSDFHAYLAGAPGARTQVSVEDAQFEELMLGLRLISGVTLSPGAFTHYREKLAGMQNAGFLRVQGTHVALTEKGFPVMNAVLRSFL